MEGGKGRTNGRYLLLNALAWSLARPRGFGLLDTWAESADAFGAESLVRAPQ